ncbi:hypothetical protein [uncultured Marivita sp.]|uniref:hypothetical protein n=1 Tax=uncultured Marivita sp. TaxID=888080 RepID=UPI0025E6F333|nr:hypothetical protein [uncultured Marivita sp.]MCR9110972.1 hypothetical protein [Paracoccaceae bacterium]
MTFVATLRVAGFVALLAWSVAAQGTAGLTTDEEVHTKISEAMGGHSCPFRAGT